MVIEQLRRKAYEKMSEWKKESNGNYALLIEGARRVGKTHLATQFAKENYKSHIILDFNKVGPEIKKTFMDDLNDLDLFFQKIMASSGTTLYKRNSVIVLDEIQKFPRAREAIKYLVEDGRYDYIETGSLLSIKNAMKDITIPSEEEILYLEPLDFEEFLWALGNNEAMQYIRKCFEDKIPLGNEMHYKIMEQFKKYILVGGMPQAVLAYTKTKDFRLAESVKRRILSLYDADISKFAGSYSKKTEKIFHIIPSELSHGDHEFRITSLEKDAKSRDYEDAFMWLEDGRIINQCFASSDPNIGLMISADFMRHKCYMADTGLLVSLALADKRNTAANIYNDILSGDITINGGMFLENVTAQQLVASGHNLFYYTRYNKEKKKSEMEVDFLIEREGEIHPIEVKSGKRITHRSLDLFMETFGNRVGRPYLLCNRDLNNEGSCMILPVYMALLL